MIKQTISPAELTLSPEANPPMAEKRLSKKKANPSFRHSFGRNLNSAVPNWLGLDAEQKNFSMTSGLFGQPPWLPTLFKTRLQAGRERLGMSSTEV